MNTVKGTFEIEITAQDDGPHDVGRFLINKAYQGEMKGQGLACVVSCT